MGSPAWLMNTLASHSPPTPQKRGPLEPMAALQPVRYASPRLFPTGGFT